MSTLRVNTIQDSTGSSSPAINGLARAWVNFNGTGTVAIRASLNVSSITDRGTGVYTINFATALSDSNYAFTSGLHSGTTTNPNGVAYQSGQAYSTTQLGILTTEGSNIAYDYAVVNIAVFR